MIFWQWFFGALAILAISVMLFAWLFPYPHSRPLRESPKSEK